MSKLEELHGDVREMKVKVEMLLEIVKPVSELAKVVAVHHEKIEDIEKETVPLVQDHEKKINRTIGAAAVIGLLVSGIFKIVEAAASFFSGSGSIGHGP